MNTIKVKFVDFSSTSFSPDNSWIIKTLRKRYNIEFSEKPDFLFYSTWGLEFLRYRNVVKVFCGGEPVSPNFNDCDYAFGYEPIVYNDRYIQYPVGDSDSPGLYDINSNIQDRSNITNDLTKRSFCNFIASQDWIGHGAKLRKEFTQTLINNYKTVDCPGFVLHNTDKPIAPRWSNGLACGQGHVLNNWNEGKITFVKNYKFTVAFENCSMSGLTTEKFIDPIKAYSIPIYWGNPDIEKIANPKAFINCNGYENSFNIIIDRIRELDTNDNLYLDMLSEKPFLDTFDFEREKQAEQFLFNIIEKGNVPFEKDSTRLARSTLAYEAVTKEIDLNSLAPRPIIDNFLIRTGKGEVLFADLIHCIKRWLKYKLVIEKRNKKK